MSAWSPLLPAALVGTDRHTGAWPPMGGWPPDVAALVHEAASAPARAEALLRAAAVLAVTQAASEFGQPWTTALPAPATPDAHPAAPADALLGWLLHEGPPRVQHELLAVWAARGQRLPEAWLPAALELGRRSIALRAPVAAVLGTRGHWLAAQRDDWRWAAGSEQADDEARWAEGTLEQRSALLRRERGSAPAAGRERLAAVLPELPANERAELVGALATGLGDEDEPLLESLLHDRSREVRQAAATLLQRLPGSAFVARAVARIEPLLRHERVLLRKRWLIEPPAEVGTTDPPRPKHEALGERAWWLYLAARQVPLAWWPRHTGLEPGELLAWAADTDWAEALHRAWRDALFAAPEPAWSAAFLRHWPRGAGPDGRAAVLALLPLAEREAHWLRLLDHDGELPDALLAQLGPGCPPPQYLSLPLSQRLAAAVRQRLASGSVTLQWPLREALPDIASLLHPQALPALRELPSHPDDPLAVGALLHSVQRIATARALLHAPPSI
ncbi:MAG: hypothetical protein ING89_10420 [Rubrivivax sp.]|nr:hypothetical protein [Rubrivivax sp.]